VPFDGIWLEAPDYVLEARVGARTSDASDADIEVVRHQSSLIEIPDATWLRLRADRRLLDLANDAADRLRLGR
jgi:uncharacterized protein